MPRVYLDNHATTRVDPRVVDTMLPYFTEEYGNAGSVGHEYGERARDAVTSAQTRIAAAIGAEPSEIVFTSGATESNNLAIRGVAMRRRRRGDHLVSAVTEHAAVLGPMQRLASQGYEVTLLPVQQHGAVNAGRLDPGVLAAALREDTCLASVMLANNEIGVIQPLQELSSECRQHGVLLHCDATQAVGKIPVDVNALGVDLMSFSAHKLYGPKGIGALYVRGRNPIVRLEPQITGGGQQAARRSGTLDVPAIVGFAKAVELATAELSTEPARQAKLRDHLAQRLSDQAGPIELCGPALDATDSQGNLLRLPNNLDVLFPGLDGESLLMRLDGIAVSSGAACSSSDPSPSHVLQALGLSEDQARSSLRFGLGRFTTEQEIEVSARQIAAAVAELREMS